MQRRLLLCIYVSSILAVSIPSTGPLDDLYHNDDTLNGSQLDKIRALGGDEDLQEFSWPVWMAQNVINQRQPNEAKPHDVISRNRGDIISVDADEDLTDRHARGLSLICGDRTPTGLKISPEIVSMISQAKKISHTKPDKAENIFKRAMAIESFYPDLLNSYAEFLEEHRQDLYTAHHLYNQAVFVYPGHEDAMANLNRIGPIIRSLEKVEYDRLDARCEELRLTVHRVETRALHQIEKSHHYLHVYHTNAIEGSPVSLSETESLIRTGRIGGTSGVITVEQLFEVISTSEAYHFTKLIAYNGRSNGVKVDLIDVLEIHKRVLSRVQPEEGGKYRTHPVRVADHIAPHPSDVPIWMARLDRWLMSDDLHLNVIERAAMAHYRLVWIHPFNDGNGRTARMLMNLILMRGGYPPALIKKEDRLDYYETLKQADPLHGDDIRPFVHFITQCLERTMVEYKLQLETLSPMERQGEREE